MPIGYMANEKFLHTHIRAAALLICLLPLIVSDVRAESKSKKNNAGVCSMITRAAALVLE
jgi:hypothetical protein